MTKKEFKVNEHIVLKMEKGKTNIYVGGELFRQCKYILILNPHENQKQWEIDSIDDAVEKLNTESQNEIIPEDLGIDAKTEFWGHCSNLQVWVEHNYDTRILHSNLSFVLLKKLYEIGDPTAKKMYKDEVAKRYISGSEEVRRMLISEGYIGSFNYEELFTLFRKIKPESEVFDLYENAIEELEELWHKDKMAKILLKQILTDDFLNGSEELRNLILERDFLLLENCDTSDVVFNYNEILSLYRTFICEEDFEALKELYNETKQILRLNKSLIVKDRKIIQIGFSSLNFTETIKLFKHLKNLFISKIETNYIPNWIGDLTKLEKLSISNCKNLKCLSETIGNLTNLWYLRVQNNPSLKTIPPSIGKMQKLIQLELNNNSLEELPEEIGDLNNLKWLYLHNNQFINFPECVIKLKNLTKLLIYVNNFKIIPLSRFKSTVKIFN